MKLHDLLIVLIGLNWINHPECIASDDGNTPLHLAAQKGDSEQVLKYLKAGAERNAKNKRGDTPLNDAVNYGHPTTAKILVEAGADVNASGSSDFTPLHTACYHGYKELVIGTVCDENARVEGHATLQRMASTRHLAANIYLLR